MSINYQQAKDEMNARFYEDWKAQSAAVVGYVPEVRWQNQELGSIPGNDKFWCRVYISSIDENQTSLSNAVGGPNQRRYTDYGLVFVQLFGPKTLPNADRLNNELAMLAQRAFRGKVTPGKIWFRNVRINELEPEQQFYRCNVIAEYEYDEIS